MVAGLPLESCIQSIKKFLLSKYNEHINYSTLATVGNRSIVVPRPLAAFYLVYMAKYLA